MSETDDMFSLASRIQVSTGNSAASSGTTHQNITVSECLC